MGMPCMDYIIADRHIIESGREHFYTEKVIRLPDMYQANNHRHHPIDRPTSRVENGLLEGVFVFCCLNNNYKIRPDVFEVWMRLLRDIDGSVLWLLGDNPDAIANLRREAEKRGVSGSRLIFAERIGGSAHLARQGCADLFLDTFPYNGHTTATDALWAGVPVLTYSGETFASRVAGSLLKAAGLPELVTTSVADYERVARRLATEPNEISRIKEKLQANRPTCALFDADRFRHHLEQAFAIAHEHRRRGLQPACFDL
jgi:predicted O-linked N-acetylglucosamine transferase (SPINDLY family)